MANTTFNKTDLVTRVSELDSIETAKAAKEIVELVIATIKDQVAEGNDVQIAGLGKFYGYEQAARSGEMNGVTYSTPAKMVPKFKAGTKFKSQVAGA